jgi:hypothetical protein
MLSAFNLIILMYATIMYSALQNNVSKEVLEEAETVIQQIDDLNSKELTQITKDNPVVLNKPKEIVKKPSVKEALPKKDEITPPKTKPEAKKNFKLPFLPEINTKLPILNNEVENNEPAIIPANIKSTIKSSVKNSTTNTGPILERAQFFPNMTLNITNTGAKVV